MVVRRLFENVEIDWDALTGPRWDASADPHPGPTPSLGDIRDSDLSSLAELRILHHQAIQLGILPDSEAAFIGFLATAAYCLRVGDRPCALFAHCVRSGRYPATLEDEDRAMEQLKRDRASELGASGWLVIRQSP